VVGARSVVGITCRRLSTSGSASGGMVGRSIRRWAHKVCKRLVAECFAPQSAMICNAEMGPGGNTPVQEEGERAISGAFNRLGSEPLISKHITYQAGGFDPDMVEGTVLR
jgi:hypothetical protein